MTPNVRRTTNLLAYLAVIATNAAANALPINGVTTGQISAKYPSLFTPAGFTFSIWGIIYLLLGSFLVFQFLPGQRDSRLLRQISPWFLLSCGANVTWILTWHQEWLAVTVILMSVLLFALLRIVGHFRAYPFSPAERLFIYLPFSVYCGWISVAIIANLSSLQTALGWNDLLLTNTQWTLLKLAAATVVAAYFALKRFNAAFVLVVVWAAWGISQNQAATPEVAGAAGMLMMAGLLWAVSALLLKSRQARTKQ
jgi:hypothetical protein